MSNPSMPAQRRGLFYVRNDAGDSFAVKQAVDGLQKAFADFKAANDKRLHDLEHGREDVVTNDKVDRINDAITGLQDTVTQQAEALAGLRLSGGGAGNGPSPEQRAYSQAFGQFFRRGDASALEGLGVKSAATTGEDPDGGFLVPVEVEKTIDRVLSTVSAIRSISRVVTINTNTYRKPFSKGGATGGWVGESGDRDETDTPKLSTQDFPTMELYAQPAATQTLLGDASIDIGAWLADEVQTTFAEMEGAAFWSGDGSAQPRGIASYDTVANASFSTDSSWGKLGYIATGAAAGFPDENPSDVLINLVYGLKQGYRSNARWLMNRKTQGVIRKFKDDNGQYLWQPSVVAGQPSTLLGYPVADDDNVEDVAASKFPIVFGDFQRGYLVVDRAGVRVLRDPYSSKPYVLFYTTKRVGGGVQNFEALKLLKVSAS